MKAVLVESARLEDAPALAEVFLKGFNDEYFQTLFPQNEHGREYITRAYETFMLSKERKSQEGQVFVVRNEQGALRRMPPPTAGDTAAPPQGPSPPRSLQSADACAVGCRRDADRIKPGEPAASALIWIIRPEDNGTWSWRKRWPAVNAAQKDELVDQFFTEMATQHEHIMGRDAHIYFELIVTDPAYQRRGFALALLQRASQIADEMGYRMYLDAEKDVVPLYKSVGYVANEDVEHTSFMVPMVRPAKK